MLSLGRKLDLSKKEVENIIFVGDLHGEFNKFIYNIREQKIENVILIVCGDIGMGFNKPKYYETEFVRLQQICDKRNLSICFVRGNHDDLRYFQADSLYELSQNLCRSFPDVHLVKDYSLIITKFGNILTIGGGISIDRCKRTLNSSYWPNEFVKNFSKVDFERLFSEQIDIVVSHSAPNSFFPVGINSEIVNSFAIYDKSLKFDLLEEREMLDQVALLLFQNWDIKHWFYGHFHHSNYQVRDYFGKMIKCHLLNCHEFKQLIINYE